MALNSKQQTFLMKDEADTFSIYLRYWYVFALAIIICLGLAFLYVSNAKRFYKVSGTLLIQNDFKGDGLLKGTAFSDLDMFHGARTVDNEMEVLRSRDLIYKTLKSLSLETSYTVPGRFTDRELYGETLPVQVVTDKLTNMAYRQKLKLRIEDESTFILVNNGKEVRYRFGQVIHGPGYTISVVKGPAFRTDHPVISLKFKNLQGMAENYSLSALSVLPIVKDANTVVISVLESSPQRGVDILNTLIKNYNEQNLNTKNIVAKNTIHFIDQRLRDLTGELSEVEAGVENYKQVNRVTDVSADADINLRRSGGYDQDLSDTRLQLDLISSLQQYLNQDQYEIVPSTLGLKDATLSNLINRYNDMLIDRQRLLRNNNAANPLVLNIDEQLTALKGNLKENLRSVQRGLILQRNALVRKSSQFESIVRNVPVVERGLLQLTRDQSVKAGIYQYLLQKREETALSLSATIPTSQVIEEPAYNSVPAKPKAALIYLGSLFAGFILPMFFIYSRNKLNTTVQDVTDVQLIGGTRILGELSHKEENNTVVVRKGSRTTISELFRYIRSNLGYINNNTNSQVLLVTSGMKGEGKTFFSINLGITLSMVNKKVVVVEFDLRKPDLIKGINMRYEKGVTDFLSDEDVNINQLIKPSGVAPNLYVMGCGKLPDDPAELLTSPKIDLLFETLREQFDYIIVDTSPVGQVADAFNIAPYADASIYLIRYNFTEKLQLGVLDDICENNKLKNLMIVFNDAKKENMKSYGYGSGGAYASAG